MHWQRHIRRVFLGWIALGALLWPEVVAQSTPAAPIAADVPLQTAASGFTHGTSLSAPAQLLFNQVNQLLQANYGGLSGVNRLNLAAEYQKRLDAVCAAQLQTCTLEKAYPVVQAEVTALGDEHSYFQTPEDFQDFLTNVLGGERRQFGVKLAQLDGENRVVLEVVPRSAAETAGLQRGDILLTLDGKPYRYDDLHAARLAGHAITLGLQRAGQRLGVVLSPSESSTLDLPRLSLVGAQKDVALIRIPTFLTEGVAQRVHDFVGQAKNRGVRGIVVDLRGDGGGSLSECDRAASAFVPDFSRLARTPSGDVRTRVRGGVRLDDNRTIEGVRNAQFWSGPVAVIVDAASASCSEFFAFEMQYAGRGPVVGEETAGVGNTATRVFELNGNAALQLTIANYVKPDGTPYPVRVKPDRLHPVTESDIRLLTAGEDVLLNLALNTLSTAPTLQADRK